MPRRTEDCLTWVQRYVCLQRLDRVLEIGCGPGKLASMIMPRLGEGSYTGIDPSAHAIEAAARSNLAGMATGRMAFHATDLENAPLPAASFDKVIAVNVDRLWVRAGPEFGIVRSLMAPAAVLYLVYQLAPTHDSAGLVSRLIPHLHEHRLSISAICSRQTVPKPTLCVEIRGANGEMAPFRPVRRS